MPAPAAAPTLNPTLKPCGAYATRSARSRLLAVIMISASVASSSCSRSETCTLGATMQWPEV